MTEAELSTLLDDVRRELGSTVDELERSRSAHRQVETLLLAVLEHVPSPIVVVDGDNRVRASSASAEREWGVQLDAPLPGTDPLGDLAGAVRRGVEEGAVPRDAIPAGFGV